MKKVSNVINFVINFVKKVWPSIKIFIKTVAPII